MRFIWTFLLALLLLPTGAHANDQPPSPAAEKSIQQSAGVPLDKPNMDTSAILSWAAQAVTDIMTARYDNYQKRLQRCSHNFTKTGWESFAAAMQRSRILDQVHSLKQMAVAKLTAPPQLVKEGPALGKYRWSVKIPLEMTYTDEKATHTATMSLDLVVERVSTSENGSGLSIASWDMTQLTGDRWRPACPPSKH